MERVNKAKNFFSKNKYFIITFILITVIYFIRFLNYDLYRDDHIYKKVAVCDLPRIFQFIKWHMTMYNGRTLIHTVLIFFLRNKFTTALCKLIGAFFIPFTGCIVANAVSNEKDLKGTNATFSLGVFSLVGTIIFCESVFWMSGAFNYFYTTLAVIGIYIIYSRNPKSFWLFPMALIAGATTEQVGIMAIGLFVILIADRFIQHRKIDVRLSVQLLICMAGYLSVILSPGTSSRMEKQGGTSFASIINNIFMVFRDRWFSSLNLIVILGCITLAVAYWLIKLKDLNKFTKKAAKPLVIYLVGMFIINAGYIVLDAILNHFIADFNMPTILNYTIFVVWILYVTLFFVIFAYSTILIYLDKKEILPFIAFALGTGSQMVMGVSERTLFRACLPAILMYIVFITYTFSHIYSENKEKIKIKTVNKAKIGICVMCVLICIANSSLMSHFMVFDPLEYANTYEPLNEEEMKEYTDLLYEKNIEYYKTQWEATHKLTDFSKY